MVKTGYAFALCVVAVAAIALQATALGTPEWTVGNLTKPNGSSSTCSVVRKLGLFQITDYGSCTFKYEEAYSVYDEDIVRFNHGMQYTVIVFVALSLLSALISMAVSAFNVCSNPYETLLTSVAILGYNVAGGVFTLLAVIVYTALMYSDLREPLLYESVDGSGSSIYGDQDWVMKEDAYFGYSFFLLVVSLVPFLLGILLAMFSEKNVVTKLSKLCCPRGNDDREKDNEIDMMY